MRSALRTTPMWVSVSATIASRRRSLLLLRPDAQGDALRRSDGNARRRLEHFGAVGRSCRATAKVYISAFPPRRRTGRRMSRSVISRKNACALPGGVLRVSVLHGADDEQREKLHGWLSRVTKAIVSAYGRLPLPDVQVLVLPMTSHHRAVMFGQSDSRRRQCAGTAGRSEPAGVGIRRRLGRRPRTQPSHASVSRRPRKLVVGRSGDVLPERAARPRRIADAGARLGSAQGRLRGSARCVFDIAAGIRARHARHARFPPHLLVGRGVLDDGRYGSAARQRQQAVARSRAIAIPRLLSAGVQAMAAR